jgi:protein disulfide-isomerase-like protein
MLSRLREFDLYRKIPKDLTETSTLSTGLSVCAAVFMLILFVAELWAYLTLNISSNIILDPNTENLLRINFNITVLDVACEYAVIDVVDVLGTRTDNVTVNINKWQVDENGLRRNYEGRNQEQRDLLHDDHHDLVALHANGIHAIPLDQRNFDNWLSHHEYTFVNFYAPWCIWCQRLHPVWEAFAEKVEAEHLPVSVVQVDCVENRDLCMEQKIQAFPMLRMFKHGQPQSPDYRSDRTIDALMEFVSQRLAQDEHLQSLKLEDRTAHLERQELERNDHPGCMMSGFLLVNRVPGNFHIEMRSKHHNFNPAASNLSHIVNSLSFGPVLPRTAARQLESIPTKFFTPKSIDPMNGNVYTTDKLHSAFHHYIKVVSTEVDLGGRYSGDNSLLVYQMVQSSQVMSYEDNEVPEARFSYDLSPMAVVITRRGKHLYEFITSMCAITGGTFTVVGLLNGFLHILFKAKKG